MTNFDKIKETLGKLFPTITQDELASLLEGDMSSCGGTSYRCATCGRNNNCELNDKSCWMNILDWLNEEASGS